MIKPYFETELGKLYHGDCLEILPRLGPVDLVITDPPYGCSATTGWGGKYNRFSIVGDDTTRARDALLEIIDCAAAVFGSPRIPRPKCKAVLIWAKGEHTGMGDLSFPWKPDFEEVYIIGDGWAGKRTTSILRVNARTDSCRSHPTEKPVPLIIEIIKKAPKGTVSDPFIGSGTTAVACERLSRKWIGIEISEQYCEVAAKRIQAEAAQLKLFG
jgi:site-specific DNA-methyltransferase (adenine-specific)